MMNRISLSILDKNNNIFCKNESRNNHFAYLTRHHNYAQEDYYQVKVDEAPCYVIVQFDESIQPALIYMKKRIWNFRIPFQEERESAYPEGAFLRRNGYAWARLANIDDINAQHLLSQNTYDQHESSSAYPHASANAETGGYRVFWAINAIDGVLASHSHGNYPFQSWGIASRKDAALRIDFGRKVLVDRIGIVLRADYPHDSYWKKMTVKVDEDLCKEINLIKTGQEQFFDFNNVVTSSLVFTDLIQDEAVEGFTALTQVQVFGRNL